MYKRQTDIIYADTANMAPYVNGGWMQDITELVNSTGSTYTLSLIHISLSSLGQDFEGLAENCITLLQSLLQKKQCHEALIREQIFLPSTIKERESTRSTGAAGTE